MLDSVFLPDPPADSLGRFADHVDGAYSILTGIAAHRSIDSGRTVDVEALLGDWAGEL